MHDVGNITRDGTRTVSGTFPVRNNVGSVAEHFLFWRWNILSIFYVLSETARRAK